jgi:hypothetical protein
MSRSNNTISALGFFSMLALVSLSAPALTPTAQTQTAPRSDTTVRAVAVPPAPALATLRTVATVGRLDGPTEYIFGDIETFTLGRDNSIFVGESGATITNVRQFDSTGRYVRTFGRRGQGPGEFRRVDGVAVHPDGRVLIVDGSDRSILVFSSDARFLTKWSVDPISPCADNAIFTVDNGAVYLCGRFGGYVRLSPDGAIIDTLMPPPAPALPPSRISGTGSSGSPATITVEHAPAFRFQMSRLGYWVTGRTDRFSIDLLLPTRSGQSVVPWKPGDPITSLRMDVPPVPFSADELAILRERLDTRMRSGSAWNMSGVEIPRTRPAFWNVIPALDGRLFMIGFDRNHRYTREELSSFEERAPRMWDIIDPSGRHVGQVRTEPGVWIVPGYGDSVLLFNPSLDVPQISRAVLQWPR